MRTRRLLRFVEINHATKHFPQEQHPLIRSIEPGETWTWCYVDEAEPVELEA